jgi:hypothetical protein
MARLGNAGTEWHGVVWRDGATPRQQIGRKVMVKELIQELRSYPASYTSAHRAADALENSEKNRLVMDYYACRLEDDLVKLEVAAESMRECISEQQLDIVTMREAMEKIASLRGLHADDIAPTVLEIARTALGEEEK